eukprot:10223642-Karenia_brevis.AAC.1
MDAKRPLTQVRKWAIFHCKLVDILLHCMRLSILLESIKELILNQLGIYLSDCGHNLWPYLEDRGSSRPQVTI